MAVNPTVIANQAEYSDAGRRITDVRIVASDGTGLGDANAVDSLPVTAGVPTSTTVTIANGASLSGAAQIAGKLVGIITPTAWTAAGLTFQGSQDGVTYYNLYDDAVERAVASASVPTAEARMLSLDLNDWLCVNYLKVRSGTTSAAVNQGGSRTFTLVLAG